MSDVLTRLATSLEGRYTIERELGAGGMATVYLAHDVRHDRKVALKVLRPELSAILGGERFLKEIRTTANLQHPHILSLFDSGDADGTVFYVMPYVEGESVRDRLVREKQLPVDDAVRIAKEVADALEYAHGHGIVHRDIKPENILLHGGHALVADFGIALAASRSDGGTRMTETGMSLGTPHYMAPEQAMGEREITPKADIYALGCVLYEMLSGEPPFTGPTAQAIIARVMTENPRSLTLQRRTIPPHVEAVVQQALEKLPADRFASAAAFAAALARPDLVSTRTPAAPDARGAAARAGTRRTAAIAAAGLLAGAALGGIVAWRMRPIEPPHPVARMSLPLSGTSAVVAFTPTLSPDGARIAFIGRDSAGTNHVYLRSLDREAPVPVAGTEGTANSPVFSPDGQWIAFRQSGKLRRVNVAGGAALAIADVPGAIGGLSWGSRDVIAIVHGDTLKRVSANGGRVEVVLQPDTAAGITRYIMAHFLPDGRHVVVSRIGREGLELVTVDIESAAVTPLGIGGMSPWYVDAGLLIYADSAGTLLATPFDTRRRAVTGPAEPIAEGVAVSFGTFARFSASRTGTIAYFTGAMSERRELVVLDRTGRTEPVAANAAAFRSPRFSPDGRRLAVSIEAVNRTVWGDIWEYSFGSRRLTRLTFDQGNTAPEWSPDGRFITFISGGSAATSHVYRVAADGSTDPAPLFSRLPNRLFEARLLPDGRHLVFREDANARDVLIAPVDSPAAARALAATSFNERAFAVSPDGLWVAFVSNLSGSSEVYVRRIEEGSPRWKATTRGGIEPRWGPGARELFFRDGDSVFVVSAQLGAEASFGEPRALFAGPYQRSGNDVTWDVSPDGQRFAMVRQLGVAETTSLHLVLHLFDQRARR